MMDFKGTKGKLLLINLVLGSRVGILRLLCINIFSMLKTLKIKKNRKNYWKKIGSRAEGEGDKQAIWGLLYFLPWCVYDFFFLVRLKIQHSRLGTRNESGIFTPLGKESTIRNSGEKWKISSGDHCRGNQERLFSFAT